MIVFWIVMIALTMLAYVVLDGFDLGVGILFGFTRDELRRREMLAAISPVWDGNETWLVITGTLLFGAFPVAYAALLSAFYLPLILMLAGLILRGVAFEYRYKSSSTRWIWDAAFFGGSLVATAMQGLTIGALVQGLPLEGRRFAGTMTFWFGFFPITCGVGLSFGYALLGAAWLVGKSNGVLRQSLRRAIPYLIFAVILFFAVTLIYSLGEHLEVMQRWTERPVLGILPVLGLTAALTFIHALKKERDRWLFPLASVVFTTAFLTLAGSIWPYMIPFGLTVYEAASPASSLRFMFWGLGLIALPLTAGYTIVAYRIFRGQLIETETEPETEFEAEFDSNPLARTL
jgi:cytochrome d ubiquinol oxidase subunit II